MFNCDLTFEKRCWSVIHESFPDMHQLGNKWRLGNRNIWGHETSHNYFLGEKTAGPLGRSPHPREAYLSACKSSCYFLKGWIHHLPGDTLHLVTELHHKQRGEPAVKTSDVGINLPACDTPHWASLSVGETPRRRWEDRALQTASDCHMQTSLFSTRVKHLAQAAPIMFFFSAWTCIFHYFPKHLTEMCWWDISLTHFPLRPWILCLFLC